MFILKDLPNAEVLSKFVERYPEADISSVLTFLKILRIGFDFSDALDQFLMDYGLLQGRWWVLILLMREETLTSTPSGLADKAGVTRATMTKLLNGLVKDGFVQRLIDATDGRRFSIKLTPSGQQKLDEIMPEYYRRVKQLMRGLDKQECDELVDQLEVLSAQVKKFLV